MHDWQKMCLHGVLRNFTSFDVLGDVVVEESSSDADIKQMGHDNDASSVSAIIILLCIQEHQLLFQDFLADK